MPVYVEKTTGRWVAELTRQGRRVRARFDTKKEANAWLASATLGMPLEATGKPVQAVSVRTLGVVAREARSRWKGLKDQQVYQRIDLCVMLIGSNTPIERVRTEALDKLVTTLSKRRCHVKGTLLSPGTINRYLAAISGVLQFAHEREWITGKPSVPWQHEPVKEMHAYTPAQVDALCELLEARQHAADAVCVRVLFATGIRLGELHKLTARHIDPEAEWLTLNDTKNGDNAGIPLEKALCEQLLAVVAQGVPAENTMRRRIQSCNRHLGHSEALGIHSLRHATGTTLLKETGNIRLVQSYLRHKSLTTTLRYTHVDSSDLRKAAGQITGQTALKRGM